MAEKLTKKQLKAQQFKKSKEEREHDKSLKRAAEQEPPEEPAPAKKKRKTRRGKKGKSRQEHHNRFLVFVGNLDKETSQTELQAHFKSSSPDQIRLRPDKGIAFLEFEPKDNIQRRMDIALLQHKTTLRGRQINVELTVGGGGNSNERLQKLQQKNEKLINERRERIKNMVIQDKSSEKSSEKSQTDQKTTTGVHPDRAKLLQ
ncbi:hypothetical protein ZYGR_0I04070 [Zygosaccharomyces rouxii]|uniref:ZYRO0C09746p n=2 Tax=Zygosaccharomyces rouxii TaxID=4956 RepID=C5DTM4_ZYGRC|nr:uncharacterized protein ZYRO0C09746g [Zygosaccharomyces rouxii]KAH9201686.1 hypothetical protein LQ764DRAFT_233412 [Zygosaccharomyces rouxii]GAV48110.1 hypothetical protein ZYGR_0I04070 [Zygosaccharomyces rouxii]CAR27135.1 ZYRO0C09746p [Zygosaccharomyces rouxii]